MALKKLLYTNRGITWRNQFDYKDRGNASKLVESLTLVSHNEFERNLLRRLEETVNLSRNTVALFAVREVDTQKTYFVQAANKDCIDALPQGSNHGSEARVASIIRNFYIQYSGKGKVLNHPTIEKMRIPRTNEIIFIDDFIGSGNRVVEFLDSFCSEPTISSWLSFKYLKFKVLSYSGTEEGVKAVSKHRSCPEIVLHIKCPTLDLMPWPKFQRNAVIDLCRRYGRKSHTNKNMWCGFRNTKGVLVFEHGCPNNVPSVLWGSYDAEESWSPLFPRRAVSSEESSIFPPEIIRGDSISLLVSVGQERLAESKAFNYMDEEGEIALLVLALLAKGKRKNATLFQAMALSEAECEKIIERCIGNGLITPTKRLTKSGYNELNAVKKSRTISMVDVDIGEEYYYPIQLRKTTYG